MLNTRYLGNSFHRYVKCYIVLFCCFNELIMISMLKILIISSYLCFVHASFFDTLKFLDWNKAIQEQALFKEIFPVSLIECARYCLSRPSTCLSFNYRRTLLLCQLSDSNDMSLVKHSPLTVHSMISTWPKNLIGKCATITCPKGNLCDEKDASCKLSECDIIPKYSDMRATNFDRSIGFVVEYKCTKERYVSVGNMTIICQRNGTWSSLEGSCELGYCEVPPTVMNSIIIFGSNKIGRIRTYICNPLYFMTGKSTITCQKNGTWTTPGLVCHERCPISKGFRYRKEEDICYKIIYQNTSHDEAEKECWRYNSTLVTIRSKTTQDLVIADLHTKYSRFRGYHIDAIYDRASNVWTDKNGRKLVYTDWITDPVSTNAVMNPCAIVVNTSKWSSEPCSVLAFPVCEYGRCPKSYEIYPNLNLCYKIHNIHKLNRTDAQSECQENDGNLLVIDNAETQYFIESVDNNVTSIHAPKQNTGLTGYAYTLLTEYGYSVGTSTSITLMIKACNDAHVGLMPENDGRSTDFYEIAIGGWEGKKSVLRRQKQSDSPVDFYSPGRFLLSCSQFKKFTFSWTSGTIKVSEGDGTEILKYQDPHPYQVNFIGVTGGNWANVTVKIYTEEFYWISGQNINGAWMDDRNRNMSYFNWNYSQPNEVPGQIGIFLHKHNSLGTEYWFDEKQSQKHFFICEYPYV